MPTSMIPDWRVAAPPGISLAKAKAQFGATPVGKVEFAKRAASSGISEPPNFSQTLDVQRIQNAIRAAERGDTYLLFAIFRDMTLGYSHFQAEFKKRKSVITGQPYSLSPYNKGEKADEDACEIIRQMIDNCVNWRDGLTHLLDATLWPMSVAEKIYEDVSLSDMTRGKLKYPVQFLLKELAPVSYTALCFRIPYQPSFQGGSSALQFNANDWEAWLRLYEVSPSGMIQYGSNNVYKPDPNIHVVHRANGLSPVIPPNMGGVMRAILYWWLIAIQDRDWWALMMNKYGMPLMVGKADAAQVDTVEMLQQAFRLASQLGGLVVPKDAEVVLEQMSATDGSNAHKILSTFCNDEVSKLVLGQVLSSSPKSTGMGSGMAEQAEGVRNDLRVDDQTTLCDTLRKQVFQPYLEINGISGNAPMIYWGGMRPQDAKLVAQTQALLYQGGIRATKLGVESLSEQLGYELEQIPQEEMAGANPNRNKTGKEAKGL